MPPAKVIVFLVWPDLESQKGDISEPGGGGGGDKDGPPKPPCPLAAAQSTSAGGIGEADIVCGMAAVTTAEIGLGFACRSGSTLMLSAAEVAAAEEESESAVTPASSSAARLSYSVSYFSWSVSEDSDEDEDGIGKKRVGGGLEALCSQLERVKIRRSSRERNELRSAASALRLPAPPAARAGK